MSNLSSEDIRAKALDVNQMQRLFQYLKPYKLQLLLTCLLMFAAALTDLLGPYLLQRSVDIYIANAQFLKLLLTSLLYAFLVVLTYLCNRIKIRLANRTGQNALLDLRRDLFNHVQRLSFDFFGNTSAGRIMVRIVNDVNTLSNLFTNGIVNVLTELAKLVVASMMMIIIHPKLALVTLATAPIFMTLLFLTRNAIKRRWRMVRVKLSNLNSYIHENIVGMKVIQAYVRQKENSKRFHSVIGDVYSSWMEAIRINSAFGPAVELVSVIGNIIIFWYGARLLAIDGITVGVVISFTVYLRQFWQPINMLSNFYNQLLVAMASSERIFELMDAELDITSAPEAVELEKVQGAVEFKDISFGYKPDQLILKDINLKVKPGETIAIVGPTGSGKTTFINLLARFYDPNQGQVLIDGRDIRQIKIESLRKHMGVMLQDPFIFSGTVIDNIRYGKLDATEEEVVQVAKAVHAHDFIEKMEDGYYTMVNERGARLSIGQRQLICFARVLLADPDILILDEATASVDTHTELLLQKAIDKLLEGRTSFVIAHRLSTIRNADRIMVIDNGQIAEIGTHDQLVAKRGLYYNLYTVQYKYLHAS